MDAPHHNQINSNQLRKSRYTNTCKTATADRRSPLVTSSILLHLTCHMVEVRIRVAPTYLQMLLSNQAVGLTEIISK